MSQISNQINSRETKEFYVCKRCDIEFNAENALLNDFTCNECGDIFTIKDNTKVLKELRKNYEKNQKEMKLIDEEIEKEKERLEKERAKEIKKEEKLKTAKKKLPIKTAKKTKKRLVKKNSVKKTAKKKVSKKKIPSKTKKKGKKK